MIYKELKEFCDNKIKEFPQYEKMYCREILFAKRYYDNGRNLFEELTTKPITKKYVIPFLLGLTKEIIEADLDMIQVKEMSNSALDIDADFDPEGKKKIYEYLINKYGEERVLHVGTFSRLGPASAAKDLLRIYKIDYKVSNEFTKLLDASKSWEDNINIIKDTNQKAYNFYLENKTILDLTPFFINKIRQSGTHAGGIVILDKPAYERIPVDRVSGDIVTAFPESGQEQVLDILGIVKFDILAITILDVIRNTINMIDEKLFLVEEDGIQKIVSKSYLKEVINENAQL